jgi:hypothetical protein
VALSINLRRDLLVGIPGLPLLATLCETRLTNTWLTNTWLPWLNHARLWPNLASLPRRDRLCTDSLTARLLHARLLRARLLPGLLTQCDAARHDHRRQSNEHAPHGKSPC